MISSKYLRMGIQKTPILKTYEMSIGSQSFNLDFLGRNRKFDWVKILLVYDNSDKHSTIYHSYNLEKATISIQSIELENVSKACSLTNQKNMTSLTIHKNTCFTNSLWPGTVMVIPLFC